MKWYQDKSGDISSLRLIVVPAAYVAQALMVAGAVAMFMTLPASAAAIASGGTLVAACIGAKAWQKKHEGS